MLMVPPGLADSRARGYPGKAMAALFGPTTMPLAVLHGLPNALVMDGVTLTAEPTIEPISVVPQSLSHVFCLQAWAPGKFVRDSTPPAPSNVWQHEDVGTAADAAEFYSQSSLLITRPGRSCNGSNMCPVAAAFGSLLHFAVHSR